MWCDAHNHLHDERLDPFRQELLSALPRAGILSAIVNGTQPSDWPAVADLCSQQPWLVPAFGLHPWRVPARPASWLALLDSFLSRYPLASVGEIGLDAWIEGHDLADQIPVLAAQLELASAHQRPATIHCVRAWEPLRQFVRTHRMPPRGFLLHAFSGPVTLIPFFVDHGAYFSFSPYFLHPRKTKAREAFRSIPPHRILLETDAPDLAPPPEAGPWTFPNGAHNPLSLPSTAAALAHDLAMPPEDLASLTTANFQRLFQPLSRAIPTDRN
jgi:TatD DNase family protein